MNIEYFLFVNFYVSLVFIEDNIDIKVDLL